MKAKNAESPNVSKIVNKLLAMPFQSFIPERPMTPINKVSKVAPKSRTCGYAPK
jgi:hypothetical protein